MRKNLCQKNENRHQRRVGGRAADAEGRRPIFLLGRYRTNMPQSPLVTRRPGLRPRRLAK